MSTPIYDGIKNTVDLAREGGEMRGRLAERQEILALAQSISSKPTSQLKKLIETLEKRLHAPLVGVTEPRGEN